MPLTPAERREEARHLWFSVHIREHGEVWATYHISHKRAAAKVTGEGWRVIKNGSCYLYRGAAAGVANLVIDLMDPELSEGASMT